MKSERGYSIIEVIVAIAILGAIGAAFLGGLATASKAILVDDERATAESRARTEMEYVKNEPFAASYVEQVLPEYSSAGYSATIAPPVFLRADLQKITITIKHHGRTVLTLEGYKVNR